MANNEDLGLGEKYDFKEKRLINKDGSFNVIKHGSIKGVRDTYTLLLEMSWTKFILVLLGSYFLLNLLFACIYFVIGVENLEGADTGSAILDFMSCFYFSSQTFTTVGYGIISPKGAAVNLVAATEAMVGLLSFSLATGLLFGRFSRPHLKLAFSDNMLISDYAKNNGKALMFKLANKRNSVLLETKVEVIATYNIEVNGEIKRTYRRLDLEIAEVKMLPTQWTVVHPIDENSLFSQFSLQELTSKRLEVLILIKSVDESYSHPIFERTSYKAEEIIDNANFVKNNQIGDDGNIIIDLHNINSYEIKTE